MKCSLHTYKFESMLRLRNPFFRNLHGKTAWDLARTEEMTQALSTALVQEKVAKTVTVRELHRSYS